MKLIRKNDFILIAVVLAVCAVLFFAPKIFDSNKKIATVIVDGKEAYTIDLSNVEKQYTINIDSDPETEITVDKDTIWFSHAECNDKICIKSGKLKSNGQSAACLPSKVAISISGGKSENDMLTY